MRSTGTIGLFIAALSVGCQSTQEAPTQADITQEVVAEANVLSVDPITRELELERRDGTRFVIVAGPEVRNFDQIEVGETLKARYVESLSVRLLGPDEVDTEPVIGLAAGRAEAGMKPAGVVGTGAALTVRVQSVDKKQHLVVFTDPGGQLHAVHAKRLEGRQFIAGLKPGDRVELIMGESLILAVD